jgi:hypothetical protein
MVQLLHRLYFLCLLHRLLFVCTTFDASGRVFFFPSFVLFCFFFSWLRKPLQELD